MKFLWIQLSTKVDRGYKRNNTFRIGSAMLTALAAVFIILLLTACPNAAGGGTENGGNSGSGTGGNGGNSNVHTIMQQAFYESFLTTVETGITGKDMEAGQVKEWVDIYNALTLPIGFKLVDKAEGTGVSQGTTKAQLKARFVMTEDSSALSPYAPILSEPAGIVLVITEFNPATKQGRFVVAGTVSGEQVLDSGDMKINAEGTEVTISDANTADLNGNHLIANKKVTVMEHTFNLSALLK